MSTSRNQTLAMATAFLLLAPLAIAGVALVAPAQIIAAGITLLIGGLLAIALYRWGADDVFSPPFVIALATVFFSLLGLWYFEFLPDSTGALLQTKTVWLATLLGFGGMYAGLLVGKNLRVPDLSRIDSRAISPVFLGMLCLASLPVAIVAHLVPPGSAVHSVVTLGGHCFLALPLVAAFTQTRNPSRQRFVLIATTMFTMFLVLMVFGSERRTVTRVMLFGIIAWHYRISPLRIRTAFILFLAFIPLVYVLKIEQAARQFHDKPLWQLSPSAIVEVNRNIMNFHGESFAVVRSYNVLAALENLENILKNVPGQKDYLYGESYWKLLVAWVPREIWPDKPDNISNIVTEVSTTGYLAPAQDVTFCGEAYWNFGWTGIFLVSLAFSAILCAFHRPPGEGRFRKPMPLLYVITVPFFLEHMRGSFHVINLYFLCTVTFTYTMVILGSWFCRGAVDDDDIDQIPVDRLANYNRERLASAVGARQ